MDREILLVNLDIALFKTTQFFIFLQGTSAISGSLKEICKKVGILHTSHKLVTEPFVMSKGPTLESIPSSYVIIGDITYQVVSPIATVEICFQSVKVLHKKYLSISNHVWQLIEKGVYAHRAN